MNLDLKHNNFNLIRLLTAISILYFHQFPFAKIVGYGIFNSNISIGELSLSIFFFISGFLIMMSWERQKNWENFLIARILRIFPALVVVHLLTRLVLGPLETTYSISQYFKILLSQKLLFFRVLGNLPGVFEHNVHTQAVNGALWTIYYEFFLYLMVMLLGTFKLINKRNLAVLSLFLLFCYLLNDFSHLLVYANWIKFMLFFVIGMLCYQCRNLIQLKLSYAIFSFLILILSFLFFPHAKIFLPLFGVYLLLYLSFIPCQLTNNFARKDDLSYGIYIYAFPIQQVVSRHFAGKISLVENFLLVLIITLIFAYFSWILIERRALTYKKKILLTTNNLQVNNSSGQKSFFDSALFMGSFLALILILK